MLHRCAHAECPTLTMGEFCVGHERVKRNEVSLVGVLTPMVIRAADTAVPAGVSAAQG